MGEKCLHGDWRFGRQTARSMDLWGKGVGAVVKHELGIVRGGCLDAQVTEHGRPSSWIASALMLAHRSAVAPPGRRERAERRSKAMPVVGSRLLAAWRRAFVT